MFNSVVTPHFHPISDEEFYETPRRQKTTQNNESINKSNIPSTQERIQKLVEQNQRGGFNDEMPMFGGGLNF